MEESEITKSFNNKIENINDSIDNILSELYKIQIYSSLLDGFSSKYDNELSIEFKEINSKIIKSIQKINDKSFVLETNKLKKLIKTKSGNTFEISSYKSPIKKSFNESSRHFDLSESNSTESNGTELNEFDESNGTELNWFDNSNGTKLNNDDFDDNNDIIKRISSPQLDLSLLIDKIEFNVNNYTNKKILATIALNIFKNMFDLTELKIDVESLKEFIHQVSMYYHNNPYHNFKHAIAVLQFTYLLIIKTDAKKFLSNYELFGLAIASFVHDIDHPGHTNLFEVNFKSHLALKYNDKSVLENHHCSLAFFLIHSKQVQLLRNLDEKDFATVREMIIECVLSTDMKFHTDLIKNLENKFMLGSKSKWDWESKSDRLLFAKIITHTSDISNQVRPFEVSMEGSLALKKEFTLQIEKEKKLNLPSLDYMKLIDDKTFYSSEHFFSQNTVKPIWNVLVEMFPNLSEYKEHLETNIVRWKELVNGIGNEKSDN
jgi:hypothetical protein